MRRKCKVKPDHNTCCSCLDIQIAHETVTDCSRCYKNNLEYELLTVGVGFFGGGYAMVLREGKIQKVALHRVYDIQIIEEEKGEKTNDMQRKIGY